MPIVPGPQWLDTVQPARVTQTSSKVWYLAMQLFASAIISSGTPECVMKIRPSSMSSRPASRSAMYASRH